MQMYEFVFDLYASFTPIKIIVEVIMNISICCPENLTKAPSFHYQCYLYVILGWESRFGHGSRLEFLPVSSVSCCGKLDDISLPYGKKAQE